jgi:hypothetical protein
LSPRIRPLCPSIQFFNDKIIVQNLEIEDADVLECFRDVKPEDMEQRFRSALKVGSIAFKTLGTTERIDYIQKEFNKLDRKFSETLQDTADQLTQKVDDIFGEKGTIPTLVEDNFGENGTVDSILEDHLGDKGTFSEQLEKHFGKDGIIVKELFDPLKEGTPLNQLKTLLSEELEAIKKALDIANAEEEARQKSTQKGGDFEDICEELLADIVRNHKGDTFQRTTTLKGRITNSKKGDFIINVSGKSEFRIVIEAKDTSALSLAKIHEEIDEAIKNRGAKYGILVSKWNENLPKGVGCFNYYDDDKLVCSLGSMDDEVLHEEILHAAYCWARANILKKSATCEKVDFSLIDTNLSQLKGHLDLFTSIKSNCTNINTATRKITEGLDDIESKIEQNIRNIQKEMSKEQDVELEIT